MRPLDTTDWRVQRILRASRAHPDCSQSELWTLELDRHATGYHGTGSFNYGYVERTTPRLIREGYLTKGTKHRLTLTKGRGGNRATGFVLASARVYLRKPPKWSS